MIDIEKMFDVPVATEAQLWLDIFSQPHAVHVLNDRMTQRLLTTEASGFSDNSVWKSWEFFDGSRLNYCELSGLMDARPRGR